MKLHQTHDTSNGLISRIADSAREGSAREEVLPSEIMLLGFSSSGTLKTGEAKMRRGIFLFMSIFLQMAESVSPAVREALRRL